MADVSLDFASAAVAQIADFYSAPQSRWVRSNMVVSLDGHFVDAQNSSEQLSSELDLKILLLLRALSDVIIVGGRTARQENYKPKRCRPEFEQIARPQTRVAVISKSLNFDLANVLFHGDTKPIIFATTSSLDVLGNTYREQLADAADLVTAAELDGAFVVDQLSELGLDRVVSEGGPFMQNFLRSAGVLNEMDVTIAPLLMGHRDSEPAFGSTPASLTIDSLAHAGNHLFVRYLI
jgi:riboflavin biosynthesis pyrimidine reductase